jgi:hypothetical protein
MISQTLTTPFKEQLFLAGHNFATDTFKMALYTALADLGAATTAYSSANEVVGTGYTAGGEVLTGVTVTASGTTAYVDFSNVVWPSASFTTRGALIYNVTAGGKSVAVLDFGADKTPTTSFTVAMPANTATTALIRLP